MKRIVLGDIHGHLDYVQDIYNKECPNEVVLLGDYFDSRVISDEDQYKCFQELLKMKKHHEKGGNKFVMLIGNHDFHYMHPNERYSGYNPSKYIVLNTELNKLYVEGELQFVFADETNKILYSHAGLTNTWLKYNAKLPGLLHLDNINKVNFDKFCFTYGTHFDVHGDDPMNSPIWVRPYSLSKDLYVDNNWEVWVQIVGHSISEKPIVANQDGGILKENDPIWMGKLFIIDTLPRYYMVEDFDEDGKFLSREIKQYLDQPMEGFKQ